MGGGRGLLRPVDWLRLGQQAANGGAWKDNVIIPRDYIDFMRTPSPADRGYGGYVWLPAALTTVPEEVLRRLPGDTFWFWGHLGQFVTFSQSHNLVFVRMGVSLGDDEAPLRVLLPAFADLVEALGSGSEVR